MNAAALTTEIDALVDAQRDACLWYLRPDYYPHTREEQLVTLEAIQMRCTLDVYRRAGELKRWLLASSNETSVGC